VVTLSITHRLSTENKSELDVSKEQAQDREQVDDSFSSPKSGLLRLAARFQYLVKGLDLPAQAVPAELLDGIFTATNSQIGDQLPFDSFPVLGFGRFGGTDHGEFERASWAVKNSS